MQMILRLYNPDRTTVVKQQVVDRKIRPETVNDEQGVHYRLDKAVGDHYGEVPIYDYVRERTMHIVEGTIQ